MLRRRDRHYGYDAERRLTSLTNPPGRQWTYGYDPAGNRTSTVDAKANAAGIPALGTTTASYDRVGRLVGIDYSDATPDVSFGYDAAGNRTSTLDGAGAETRSYDAANRLTGVARGTETFAYGYDAAGRITSRAYPDGTTTALGYDGDGRLAAVTAPEGTTTYSYDLAGRLSTATLPNGVVETRTHDNAHRVATIADVAGTATVASFAYTRDPVGNPTQLVASSGTQTYGYDAADRLTSVCYATGCTPGSLNATTWTYDQVGNRLTETAGAATRTYSYNAADQLTQSSLGGAATAYAYDDNGNQTAAGLDTFAYDMAGRMTTATNAALPATYGYAYDGDGKRLRTTSTTPLGTSVTNDAWDITQPAPEIAVQRDGAGAVTRRFSYGLDRIATTAGSATSFYHHDGLGSVSRLTGATGSPQWTYTYEPFGQARSTTHDDLTAPDQPMRFAGEQLDPSGLLHLRARQYDPDTGRFTATDPLAPPIADPYVSSYVYVNDRPTVMTDPTGEKGRTVGPDGGFVGAAPKAPPGPGLAPLLLGELAHLATKSVADEITGRKADARLRELVLESKRNDYKDFPKPGPGMIVYRAHNDGKALPKKGRFPAVAAYGSGARPSSSAKWGASWTPVPPGIFPGRYWDVAGLPWWNWGIALTKAKIRDGVSLAGIQIRPAVEFDARDEYGYYAQGGLIEWVVPEPRPLYLQEIYTVGVSPGFGYVTCCGYDVG